MVDPVKQLRAIETDSAGLNVSAGCTVYAYGLPVEFKSQSSLVHVSASISGVQVGFTLNPLEARVYAAMLQAAADKSEGGTYNPMSYVDVSWGSAL